MKNYMYIYWKQTMWLKQERQTFYNSLMRDIGLDNINEIRNVITTRAEWKISSISRMGVKQS